MVILSVAITTKNGKALLARQYREMSRIRIEGLLSAFPKLANTRTTSDKQHTFVETDAVRYVYQPLETVFVLLVTTKSSNIVEDLDTLQLLTRIVKDQVPAIDEGKIVDKAFELFYAFDEIVSIGYAENLSLENVRTFLDMDSQEENLENILTRTKIDDAIAHGKRRAAQIAKQKAAAAKSKEGTGMVPTATESYQFSGGIGSNAKASSSRDESSRVGSFGGQTQEYTETKSKKPSAPMMSLKPKKKSATSSLLKEMVKEGEVEENEVEVSPSDEVEAPAPAVSASNIKVESVHVKIEEKISAEMGREGGVSKVDIKGEMYLTVTDPKVANLRVIMNPDYEERFQPKTHPNLDKKLFTDSSVLGVKSSSKKGFPTNTALKVLTWKLQTTDAEGIVPLTVSCWPTQGEGLSASVEYELHRTDIELHNVSIIIPLPTDKVNVDQVESGSYKVDHKNNQLVWTLDAIDSSNSSGTLEFSLPSADENSIFPITVNFTSPSTLSHLEVKDIVSAEDSKPVKHSNQTSLVSGEYMTV